MTIVIAIVGYYGYYYCLLLSVINLSTSSYDQIHTLYFSYKVSELMKHNNKLILINNNTNQLFYSSSSSKSPSPSPSNSSSGAQLTVNPAICNTFVYSLITFLLDTAIVPAPVI